MRWSAILHFLYIYICVLISKKKKKNLLFLIFASRSAGIKASALLMFSAADYLGSSFWWSCIAGWSLNLPSCQRKTRRTILLSHVSSCHRVFHLLWQRKTGIGSSWSVRLGKQVLLQRDSNCLLTCSIEALIQISFPCCWNNTEMMVIMKRRKKKQNFELPARVFDDSSQFSSSSLS